MEQTQSPAGAFFDLPEHISVGILVYSQEGEVAYQNPAAKDILAQVVPKTAIPRHIQDWFLRLPHEIEPPQDLETGMFPREVRLKSKEEGEELLLGYEVSILQKEELEQKHYLMYFRDITKFERLRLERDRYLRMACMSRLLPTIAHEIKNPLAGIQSIAEVLMEELEQGTQRDDLALILNEAHRLKFIVDRMTLAERDLLNVATSTELHKVLHKAFKLTQARAWHLGVSMELKCEELEAYVEPNLLLMILLNLLYNSLEACQPNNRIVVALEQSTDKIEIRVSDNGEGMEASTLEQATNLFFSTKPTGLGIGLTLVKNILKRCGGEFDIWSQKGLGTRVTLSFARRMS